MLIAFVCFSNLIKVLNTLHENIEGERQRKSEKLFLYIVHACYDVQMGLEIDDLFCILLPYWLFFSLHIYMFTWS